MLLVRLRFIVILSVSEERVLSLPKESRHSTFLRFAQNDTSGLYQPEADTHNSTSAERLLEKSTAAPMICDHE
jgi:hypothetical protein